MSDERERSGYPNQPYGGGEPDRGGDRGGEGGMRHFLSQFGPALRWPWTKLTDVPELTDPFLDKLAAQSDAQAGGLSIRELERQRDDGLVAILQALGRQGLAAGQVLRDYEARRRG